MAHIGANIRALRTKNEVTLPALAQRAGISKGLLSKIETDEASNPSISTLYKIAEGLDTSVAVLLGTERVAVKKQPPEENAEWRKKMASVFKGKDLDPHILDAIQHLRNRKGTKGDDIEHWKFLYTSIENSFKE